MSPNRITSDDIYSVLKTEMNISKKIEEVGFFTFQDLNVQLMDVNWTLNVLEWKYGLIIMDDDISLQTNIDDFIHIVLSQV